MSRTLVLGVVALALAAVFVTLGFWQLRRGEERQARNAELRQRLESPPLELTASAVTGPGAVEDLTSDSLAYRRAIARGRYDHTREAVVRGRSLRGAPGVDLVIPLVLDAGGEIPVDRGFVPSPDAAGVDRRRHAQPGPVVVEGYLRRASPAEVRDGVRPGFVLERLPDPSRPGYPRPRGLPELGSGPHLSYAIQWFAFAVIAVVGYGALVAKQRRPRRKDVR